MEEAVVGDTKWHLKKARMKIRRKKALAKVAGYVTMIVCEGAESTSKNITEQNRVRRIALTGSKWRQTAEGKKFINSGTRRAWQSWRGRP